MSISKDDVATGCVIGGVVLGTIGLLVATTIGASMVHEARTAGYYEGLATQRNSTRVILHEPTHQPRAVYGQDAREYCVHGQVFLFSNDGMMQGLNDAKYEPLTCKE